MGPGWPTPFNVIVASDNNPITSSTMLRRVDRFERVIAGDPRVDSVVGPGAIRGATYPAGVRRAQSRRRRFVRGDVSTGRRSVIASRMAGSRRR